MDDLALIFLLGFVLLLVIIIVRSILISIRFRKIERGMTYEQVVSIVGLPKRTETSGDIRKCIYSFSFATDRDKLSRFSSGPFLYKIVVLRNDKVVYIV